VGLVRGVGCGTVCFCSCSSAWRKATEVQFRLFEKVRYLVPEFEVRGREEKF